MNIKQSEILKAAIKYDARADLKGNDRSNEHDDALVFDVEITCHPSQEWDEKVLKLAQDNLTLAELRFFLEGLPVAVHAASLDYHKSRAQWDLRK